MASAGITTTDTNKTVMTILGILLATMALGVFTNAVYAPVKPAKPGYPLPSGEPAATAKAEGPKEEPLPILLAKADAKKGEADTKVCQSCHSFDKGGVAKVGPPLYGVVGRPKGSIAGFAYSDGMKAKGGNWTYEDLYQFITKPSAYVQGTKMTYPGEPDPQKKADIEAYLQTDSDAPVPSRRRTPRLRRRRLRRPRATLRRPRATLRRPRATLRRPRATLRRPSRPRSDAAPRQGGFAFRRGRARLLRRSRRLQRRPSGPARTGRRAIFSAATRRAPCARGSASPPRWTGCTCTGSGSRSRIAAAARAAG